MSSCSTATWNIIFLVNSKNKKTFFGKNKDPKSYETYKAAKALEAEVKNSIDAAGDNLEYVGIGQPAQEALINTAVPAIARVVEAFEANAKHGVDASDANPELVIVDQLVQELVSDASVPAVTTVVEAIEPE